VAAGDYELLAGEVGPFLVVEAQRGWSVEDCADASWHVIEETLLAIPGGSG
jgi:hypothetical protein